MYLYMVSLLYCDQHVCMSIRLFVCLFVCLSVCWHISKTAFSNFTKFSVRNSYTCGRGFVLLGWQRNMLCLSGFVDDVMFSHKGASILYILSS